MAPWILRGQQSGTCPVCRRVFPRNEAIQHLLRSGLTRHQLALYTPEPRHDGHVRRQPSPVSPWYPEWDDPFDGDSVNWPFVGGWCAGVLIGGVVCALAVPALSR